MSKRAAGRRILMLLENNPYEKDVRVYNEARTLMNAGYQLVVITPKADPATPYRTTAQDGAILYQFLAPAGGSGFLGYAWEYGYATAVMFLLALLVWVHEGFDIIHAHNPPETLCLIAAFFKPLGKKFMFDHHDLSPEVYSVRYKDGGNPHVHQALLWLERLTFRLADHVISTNQSYREIAIARGGVSPASVTVVRNGPDIQDVTYSAAPHPAVRDKASFILGYVGIMGPQDGIDYLLRAIHELVYTQQKEDFCCVIMGTGSVLDKLKSLAHALRIEPYVWFTGWVSSQDGTLNQYLAAIDVGLVPDPSNQYNDRCTMIKMMEYMALGKPIVAFDLPEHRVSAGEAAVYAHNNDELDFARHIAALMDDPQRRQRMGEIGKQRIKNTLAWRYQKANLLAAYEELTTAVAKKPAKPAKASKQ